MKIGYVRCSSSGQNPARQIEILKNNGCERVFTDMLSGKDTNRPGLQEMLSFIREGDILYVESISRLARSTKDLLQIIEQLQNKNIQFVSDKEKIDTFTPEGKFMLTVFAALAEMDRETIRQRQKEGIEIAKKEGKYKGKQAKSYDYLEFEELYKRWKNKEITQKLMCRRLNMSRATLYRIIKRYEQNKAD